MNASYEYSLNNMATTSHQQTSIKLVSECFVRPKHEIDAEKRFYHLGPVDVIFLTIDPIQKGLLYKFSNNSDSSFKNLVIHPNSCVNTVVSHLLEKLKHSLSIALIHFYPLAGRFATQIYSDENACSIVVDCNKGPGARLIHATALDLTVSDVHSPIDVTIAHPMFDLGEKYVNYDCHTKALLSIQVTQLHDGIFIGFSMSHSVLDGTSFIHFINMLSEIYRSVDCTSESSDDTITQISSVPIFNFRPWLSYVPTKEYVPAIKLPLFDIEKFICRGYQPEPLRERIFHFSPTSMASLKIKANQEYMTTHNNVIVSSSFQALTALVWRSITRARSLPFDQQTTCYVAVGARGRLDPPVSENYFGNLISRAQWTCEVEELLSNDLGWIAKGLHNIIRAKDGKAILERYKEVVDSPKLMHRNYNGVNSVIMGGATRFNMYGPEFGLGQAVSARMGYGNKEDGKITANPGCEGDGSVDLEICLKPHFMAALEIDEEFMNFVTLT